MVFVSVSSLQHSKETLIFDTCVITPPSPVKSHDISTNHLANTKQTKQSCCSKFGLHTILYIGSFSSHSHHTVLTHCQPALIEGVLKGSGSDIIRFVVLSMSFRLVIGRWKTRCRICLLYTSPSPRDGLLSRMPSSA